MSKILKVFHVSSLGVIRVSDHNNRQPMVTNVRVHNVKIKLPIISGDITKINPK